MGTAGGAGVVTPEAVRLDFEEANVGSRSVAALLDWLVILAVAVALNVAAGFVFAEAGWGLPDWVAITLLLLLNFAVVFGYPIGFETLWRGRTPGKAALGLRVVTVEGSPVRFRHAAIRAALGLVDFVLTSGFAAILAVLVSARHQRLGDMVAGTVVLRERTGAGAPSIAEFRVPAGAEAYAATLDPYSLRREDYEAVRAFLLRADGLAPAVRERLATRLANGLAARLGHRPPAGVSPELFLTALAGRYQQRGGSGVAVVRGGGGEHWDDPRAGVPLRPPADASPATGDFTPPA